MEGGGESINSTKPNFVNHVFNFDNDTKNELLNTLQYLVLAIIPLTFFNNLIESVIPENDESKSSFELLSEVLGHLSLLMVFLFLTNRLVTYLPSYSGRTYDNLNLINLVIGSLLFTKKSKAKLDTLFERIQEMWSGENDKKKLARAKAAKKAASSVRVSQPIVNTNVATRGPNSPDYLNAHSQMGATGGGATEGNTGSSNDMYNNAGFQGLQGAQQPALVQEPMAANMALGGNW